MNDTFFSLKEAIKSLLPKDRLSLLNYLEQQTKLDGFLETDLIAIFRKQEKSSKCPHCQSEKIGKWGNYKGRTRYKCTNCSKTFNELTGTAFHYLHNHQKALHYVAQMVSGKNLRTIAESCGISLKTSFDWRHKFMHALKNVDTPKLKGEVQADELFFPLSYKGLPGLEDKVGRKAFKRGTTRPKKKHQAIVLAVIDQQKEMHLIHTGQGTLNKKMVKKSLGKFIRKQRLEQKKDRLVFCTDRHHAYIDFANQKRLKHVTLASSYDQYVTTDGYSLARVNSLHNQLRRWVKPFYGVATKYLQRYLDYFHIIQKIKNFKEHFSLFLSYLLTFNSAFIPIKDITCKTNKTL